MQKISVKRKKAVSLNTKKITKDVANQSLDWNEEDSLDIQIPRLDLSFNDTASLNFGSVPLNMKREKKIKLINSTKNAVDIAINKSILSSKNLSLKSKAITETEDHYLLSVKSLKSYILAVIWDASIKGSHVHRSHLPLLIAKLIHGPNCDSHLDMASRASFHFAAC